MCTLFDRLHLFTQQLILHETGRDESDTQTNKTMGRRGERLRSNIYELKKEINKNTEEAE
jgi:hypothetical protein